jgi:ATP-dependent helicase/nuclease subunit B
VRQLRLQESDELDTELGKRDFGNWLHALLRHFHEALAGTPRCVPELRRLLIDAAADRATQELGLAPSEFLPFAASWPRVRASYLKWLDDHEATGASFVQAEAWKEMPLGDHLTLAGRIDRIDHLADGSALVIDYKTEARAKTADRVKHPSEDTQLAFYAALLQDDTLAALYLNLGELQATHAYRQPGIGELRDQLVMGIQDDMQRIAGGAPMPALGEGSACDFCAARGLCRKDFWESESSALISSTHGAAHV